MWAKHILHAWVCLQIIGALFLASYTISAQNCPEIIGYYPNWQWYDRGQLVKPTTIQYSKYSILNYAFFKPELNGSISSTDAWADQNLLQGQINWSTNPISYYPNTSIIDLAHNAGTKVLPSIGGWTLSYNFPNIAASPATRANFAHHCNNLIRTYNFDGIDIDWEYPGYVPNAGTPADKVNYTLFLQQIRDSLTSLGIANGKTYLLTTCIGASRANMLQIEWGNIVPIVDIINLMSYDFFGSWDPVANHNSPLYPPLQGDPTFNTDSAVTYLLNHYQVPSSKLAAGVAFYGRSAKTNGTPALFAPITGTDAITFSEDDGSPLYYNIMKKLSLFTAHWDNQAKVPYLLGNGSLQTFVSYDNPQSIAMKADYIKNKGLKGVIIWEITGDYLETSPGSGVIGSTPLIDTLRTVLCNTQPLLQIQPAGPLIVCSGQTVTLQASPGFAAYLWNQGSTSSTLTVTNPGTYSVMGITAGNDTVFSNSVVVNAVTCQAPIALQVMQTQAQQVTLQWPVTNCALFYQLRYRVSGSGTWSYVDSVSTTQYVLNGLSPGTTYIAQVKSLCWGSSQSVFSDSVSWATLLANPNQAPTVSISSPLNNTQFSQTQIVPVQVQALDNDGTITHVKLYIDTQHAGTDSVSPYNFSLNNLSLGTHTLYAVARDNTGDSSSSLPILIHIIPAGICSYPAWNASTVYLNNDTISHNNNIYRAKWWTQNDNPSTSYGNCCVWEYVMPCGGFTAVTCYRPVYDSLVAYTANSEVFLNGLVYRANWWTLNVNPATNHGPGAVWTLLTNVVCILNVPVQVWVEGYYQGNGQMRPVLYNQGVESISNSLNTDTIQVSLHEAIPPYAEQYTFKGLLSRSGVVNCSFPLSVQGNSYYVVVKHRQALETWSAMPVNMSTVGYNFKSQANQAFGQQLIAIDANQYAIFSGDINQDTNIDLLDLSALEFSINQFLFGYEGADINGDGNIDLLDVPTLEDHIGQFIFVQKP